MTLCWQRNLWLCLVVASVGACALLAGNAVARLLESSALDHLGAVAPRPPPVMGTPGPERLPGHAKDAERVIQRNLFCSRCDLVSGRPGARSGSAFGWVASALPVELVSSMWIPSDPWRSLAVIRDTTSRAGDARLFAVGRVLFETQAVILRIDPHRVLLDNRAVPGGRHEYLDLVAAPVAAPPATASPVAGTRGGPPAVDGVRCRSAGCEIDRGLIDRVLAAPARFFGATRAAPVMESGRSAGFRLYAVAPGSLWATLGLRDGDTLRAVNGRELSSVDDALATIAALRTASHVELELTRAGGGGPVRLRYDVR